MSYLYNKRKTSLRLAKKHNTIDPTRFGIHKNVDWDRVESFGNMEEFLDGMVDKITVKFGSETDTTNLINEIRELN